MIETFPSRELLVVILAGLATALGGAGWWCVCHFFVPRKIFDQHQEEAEQSRRRLAERIQAMETRLEALPTSEQMAGLRGDFRALGAQMKSLADAQQTMSRQIETLTRFLLEHRP